MSLRNLFGKSPTSRTALHLKNEVLQNRLVLATSYLEKIAEGNFKIDVNQHRENHDEDSLSFSNTLTKLRDKLLLYADRDQERLWAAEGISKFMNLIKGDNQNQKDFYNKILSFLINYLEANQGGIFLLNDHDPADVHLELSACYAYGKKKFIEKRVDIGSGLLGQCFLEKGTAKFTNLPQDYIQITSGLGESTPAFLLIVPIKYNERVLGVMEIASFDVLKDYQIEVVEKIAENLASVSLNMKNAQHVDLLLKESEVKAKKLQEQEEDLKQNIEELQATHEEMKRNEAELARQSSLLKFIIDNIPFPIFVKDELGKYTIINQAEAKLFNLSDKDIIGRDDRYFVKDDEEWKAIQDSDARVLASDVPVELPLQSFTTNSGTRYMFKTTKIPFINEVTGKKNILGVSVDLTEKIQLEKQLILEQKTSNHHTLMNVVGRQRMLSQKIGFYALAVNRGKKHFIKLLQDAIQLHDHSLNVIENGGIPEGLAGSDLISSADELLLPFVEQIKEVWLPYKRSAERIVSLMLTEDVIADVERKRMEEHHLDFIESNGEILLKVNDDLMQACLANNTSKLSEAYQQ